MAGLVLATIISIGGVPSDAEVTRPAPIPVAVTVSPAPREDHRAAAMRVHAQLLQAIARGDFDAIYALRLRYNRLVHAADGRAGDLLR